MRYFSFRWLADRIGEYGWNLQHVSGRHWFYVGKNLPQTLIEVEEWHIRGEPTMVVAENYVNVFDECIKENFGETLYDGTEKEINDRPDA